MEKMCRGRVLGQGTMHGVGYVLLYGQVVASLFLVTWLISGAFCCPLCMSLHHLCGQQRE